jgi:hypothetical protein
MESRGRQGGQGKGERGDTAKPDKPVKGVKPDPKRPGEWLQWDGHKGNWVPKPPGWKPDNVTKQVGIWTTVGVVTYWVVREGSRVLFPPRNLVTLSLYPERGNDERHNGKLDHTTKFFPGRFSLCLESITRGSNENHP